MNNRDYIKFSLELHLFFDRIMIEHSFFLEASFQEKDQEYKKIANEFRQTFSNILEDIIKLSNGNISSDLLSSGELVTKNTIDAELKTNNLYCANINTNLTAKELNLRSGNINSNMDLVNKINNINKQTLVVVENLVSFKNDILNKVLKCEMYTTNYPLLIKHIMNEAKMYYNLLNKVENRQPLTNQDIYNQELFWNNIMMEHAEFIRGQLDPSEDNLILTSDKYAEDYKKLLQNYKNSRPYLTNVSLNQTYKFRDFKIAGEEGILNCKIKSIIIPLLADHIVREANHFIRILKSINTYT